MKIRNMVFTALFAAVICAVAPFTIPIGPIPLSLATLVIYIAASSLNWKFGTLAVVLYILIGLVGIPVFSNFSGGLPKIVGPTGGFIIGYIPCALVVGLLVDKFDPKKWVYPASMILGTIILYLCGTVWFMYVTKSTLIKALTLCVIPFLIGDGVKIVLASVIAPLLRKILKRDTQ